MDLERIRALYHYNRWANARVLNAAARLTAEQFTRDLGNSFRSVRDTLAHIFGAEWIWLMRWNGTSPDALPDSTRFRTVDDLAKAWQEVEQEQSVFLGRLVEVELDRPLAYINLKRQPFSYPLWQMLVHVANHSTYHRGQVITMMRQLGSGVPVTDFLVYWDELAGS
jgi:uncharacterized damage-inducible protein DinB